MKGERGRGGGGGEREWDETSQLPPRAPQRHRAGPHSSNTPLSIYLRTFLYLFDASLGRVGQSQQSFAALMSNRRPLHSCDLGSAAVGPAAEDVEGWGWGVVVVMVVVGVSGGGGGGTGPFRARPLIGNWQSYSFPRFCLSPRSPLRASQR